MEDKRNLKKHTYFTDETGEIVVLTPKEKNDMENQNFAFMYLDQDAFLKLKCSSLKVLLFMVKNLNYNNKVILTTQEISKKLDLNPKVVQRAITDLISQGFIVRNPKYTHNWYMVNPQYFYRGNNRKQTQAIFYKYEEIFSEKQFKKDQKLNKFSSSKQNNSKQSANSDSDPSGDILKQYVHSSKRFGNNVKQHLLDYLKYHANPNKEIHKTVKQIMEDTYVSQVTIIQFLQFLENFGYIERPKRGVIKLLSSFPT